MVAFKCEEEEGVVWEVRWMWMRFDQGVREKPTSSRERRGERR